MDVQHFERLLIRYERLAGRSAQLTVMQRRYTETLDTLATAQERNRRRDRDMQAAEAKIEEWTAYADSLHSRLTKKQRQFTEVRPGPLKLEMPF